MQCLGQKAQVLGQVCKYPKGLALNHLADMIGVREMITRCELRHGHRPVDRVRFRHIVDHVSGQVPNHEDQCHFRLGPILYFAYICITLKKVQ